MDNLQNQINMMPEFKRNLLKDPPHLLKSFHYEDVLGFLDLGKEVRFQKGDTIVNENDKVDSAYLIATGKVGIWREGIELAQLEKGNFLGETFLFSKQNRMAKVVCEEESILLSFQRYDVLNFFRKKPEKLFNIFTKNIIEIQQNKINNMNNHMLNLKKRLLKSDNW